MTQQQKVFANADIDKEVERIHGLLGNPLPFSIPKFQRWVFDTVADFGSPIHYKVLEILDDWMVEDVLEMLNGHLVIASPTTYNCIRYLLALWSSNTLV